MHSHTIQTIQTHNANSTIQTIWVARYSVKTCLLGFPGGPVVKNLAVNAGDSSVIPGPKRCHIPQGN